MWTLILAPFAMAIDCAFVPTQAGNHEPIANQVTVTHAYPTWQWPNVYAALSPTFLVRVDADLPPGQITENISLSALGRGPRIEGERRGREPWHTRAFQLDRCIKEVHNGEVQFTTVLFHPVDPLQFDTGITWTLPKPFVGLFPETTTTNRKAGGSFRTSGERNPPGEVDPYPIAGPLNAQRPAEDLFREIRQGCESLLMIERWGTEKTHADVFRELDLRLVEAQVAMGVPPSSHCRPVGTGPAPNASTSQERPEDAPPPRIESEEGRPLTPAMGTEDR
jgi:hypothetical protein